MDDLRMLAWLETLLKEVEKMDNDPFPKWVLVTMCYDFISSMASLPPLPS